MKSLAIITFGFRFALGVIAFILTVELCARIDDALKYDAPLWKEYNSECLKSSDNEGISHNIPNAGFQKWQNNRDGFRGPEITPTKVAGTIRVVCLGASESYGLYESAGKEWPAQLRTLLPVNKYEVINVSVVGLGMGSYETYLNKYVLKFNPDIVIILVNPLFYASSYEKKQAPSVSTNKNEVKTSTKKSPSLTSKFLANCRCLPKIKQVLKQALQSNFPQVLKRYQVQTLQKEIRTAELKHLGGNKPKDTVSTASVESFSSDLSRFVSFLESRNIQILLSTYPALIGRDNLASYPDIFLDNRRFFIGFSLLGMVDILEKYNAAIKAVAVEHGALLADSQAVIPKSDRYFGDNVHYTDSGARVVAETIAERILGNAIDHVSTVPDRDIKLK